MWLPGTLYFLYSTVSLRLLGTRWQLHFPSCWLIAPPPPTTFIRSKRPSTTFIRLKKANHYFHPAKKKQALLSFGQQGRPSRTFIRLKKAKHYFHPAKKDQVLLSSVQKRPSTIFIRPKNTKYRVSQKKHSFFWTRDHALHLLTDIVVLQAVVNASAVPHFVKLLRSPDHNVCEQVKSMISSPKIL